MAEQRAAINARAVLAGAAAIVLLLAMAVGGAWLAWERWRPEGGTDGPDAALDFRIAGPLLESAPQVRQDDKARLLDSWQWVDRDAGIARIPIDAAIDLLSVPAPDAPREQR